MVRYEYLDHTADVKFLAYGKDLEEAFISCIIATTQVMTDVSKVKSVVKKEITVEGNELRKLLFELFDEMIFLLDTEGYMIGEVESLEINQKDGDYKLVAVVLGDNGDNYDVHTYIKAPTYSDMFIKEEDDKVTIQVVHDI